MKWKNKGHEYDTAYEEIKCLKGVYLFGAGHDGRLVYCVMTERYTRIPVLGFVDNNPEKTGEKMCGLPICAPEDIRPDDGVGLVVSFSSEFTKSIDTQLTKNGWTQGKNFWHYEEFLSIYAAYEYGQTFFSSICILPTTACNLKCKECLNFTTYIKKFEQQPLERMKAEVDLYFRCVDYTGLFFLSGGEPLLYPHLPELLEYIADTYSDRMYEFGMVTNGTILPGERLLDAMKDRNIMLTIDDYRDVLPEKEKQIDETIRIFQENIPEHRISVRKYDEWISLYPHPVTETTKEQLIDKYNRCHCPWQEYRNGELFSCNYASFADKAGISQADVSKEAYSLETYTPEHRKELMEFRLGYTEKGYVEFCKICSGYMDMNSYRVKAAEQVAK